MNPTFQDDAIQVFESAEQPLAPGQLHVAATEHRPGQRLPLAALHVQGQVLGSVMDVTLRQRFQNATPDPLEAVYLFPLPGGAAVYAFELQVAGRNVKGQVQERAAAQADYQTALDQGHRAALMEQERDNVYTLQVGNIPAGEQVEICLQYVQALDYQANGLYECRVPTVVAPRYIPGQPLDAERPAGVGPESDTDLVPDASRLSAPRLAAGFDPQTDLSICISLDTRHGISELACTQHASKTQLQGQQVRVELAQRERLDRDFVLRWRSGQCFTREQTLRPQALLYYLPGPENQGYGLLQLQAPAPAFLQQQRREILFLIDRSGSMGDYKMQAAAQACGRLLESLGPADSFAIQAFDDRLEWLHGPAEQVWFQADAQGKTQGQQFLRGLESRGGTELFEALTAGLKVLGQEPERLSALVLLTDGQVGDESRILRHLQTQLGQTLVYTIGIDTALNDAFLQRLASLGGGSHLAVSPREDLLAVLENIAAEIGYPALQKLRLELPEISPDPLPNLYYGRSLSVFFRGACPSAPVLEAEHDGEWLQLPLSVETVDFSALATLWAQSRIQQLEDRLRLAVEEPAATREALKAEMLAISCRYQVLCRLSAWLAVDTDARILNPEARHQIVQPLEMPAEWPAAMPPSAPPPSPVRAKGKIKPKRSQLKPEAPMMQAPIMESSISDYDDLDAIGLFCEGSQPLMDAIDEMLVRHSAPSPLSAPSPAPVKDQAPAPDSALQQAVSEFLNQLDTVLQALEARQSVSWQALELAYQALSQHLQTSDQAEHFPALQRLLRQEARQLLQALKAGHQAGLNMLIQRCRQQRQRCQQASSVVDAVSQGDPSRPAWEQSI